MSWDWEKLKEQQQRKGGGGVPAQVNDFFEKFKQFNLPGGPLLILLAIILFFGSSTFLRSAWMKSVLSSASANLSVPLSPVLVSSCPLELKRLPRLRFAAFTRKNSVSAPPAKKRAHGLHQAVKLPAYL